MAQAWEAVVEQMAVDGDGDADDDAAIVRRDFRLIDVSVATKRSPLSPSIRKGTDPLNYFQVRLLLKTEHGDDSSCFFMVSCCFCSFYSYLST